MDIKQDNIKKELLVWFDMMAKKYTWLQIKYEFSEKRGVFMVSFSPKGEISRIMEFNEDAVDFEDKMNEAYDTDAPLFTDGEELFRLSYNAIEYKPE